MFKTCHSVEIFFKWKNKRTSAPRLLSGNANAQPWPHFQAMWQAWTAVSGIRTIKAFQQTNNPKSISLTVQCDTYINYYFFEMHVFFISQHRSSVFLRSVKSTWPSVVSPRSSWLLHILRQDQSRRNTNLLMKYLGKRTQKIPVYQGKVPVSTIQRKRLRIYYFCGEPALIITFFIGI